MRIAYAMADHSPGPEIIAGGLAAAGAVIAGWLGWLGVRKPKADPQAVQNDGWVELCEQMRKELIAASHERNQLKVTLETREKAWTVERAEFMGQIAQLQAVAEGFERLLRRNGIDIPERKQFPHADTKIVQTTLRQDGLDEPDAP
jgi:hypothetical protein